MVLEAGKSKMEVPADPVSGESPPPGVRAGGHLLAVLSHGGGEGRERERTLFFLKKFIYLFVFIFGYVGSSLLRAVFL